MRDTALARSDAVEQGTRELSGSRSMVRRAVLGVVLIAIVAVLAGAISNYATGSRLRAIHPAPGMFLEVNGVPMHLYCTGQGSPTVVLESGLGEGWLYWQKVQPEVAKTTRVCSYDRAGIGWSDPQSGPRDAKAIASQLHALLSKAGVKPPVVLVGASAGGFYVREFTAMYPAQVTAIVFADASLPEQIEALPYGKDTEAARKKRHRDARWDWMKQASGWSRVTGQCKGDIEEGLEAYRAIADAQACRPAFATSWLGEWDEFWHSGEEVAHEACCGERPLMIISQDPDRPKPGWTAQAIAAQPIWNRLQENLKRLSPRSRRIVARGSRHHVMIDRPDVVIHGIRKVVGEARGEPSGAQNGTTVVE